jgi:dTDP-glucose pyrophosphorylase
MKDLNNYLLSDSDSIRVALERLNIIPQDLTVFVLDKNKKLRGSITDGDIRRGLLNGLTIEDSVTKVMQTSFKFISHDESNIKLVREYKEKGIKLIPKLDAEGKLISLIDLKKVKSILPIHAFIMAGGEGRRLLPYTKDCPKPLLEVGGKAIIRYNVERLALFGINHVTIVIKYLGQQIVDYFDTFPVEGVTIDYIEEKEFLGTIGALSLSDKTYAPYSLVMNSDLLTNIDFDHFFESFLENNAELIVASTPYQVQIPYAVFETEGKKVNAFVEKPKYTYYSNAGIYLFKSTKKDIIPKKKFFNATDFIDAIIDSKENVITYPIRGYWLDIGQHDEYEKAQEDIKFISF